VRRLLTGDGRRVPGLWRFWWDVDGDGDRYSKDGGKLEQTSRELRCRDEFHRSFFLVSGDEFQQTSGYSEVPLRGLQIHGIRGIQAISPRRWYGRQAGVALNDRARLRTCEIRFSNGSLCR
jgi:hypothetical protein